MSEWNDYEDDELPRSRRGIIIAGVAILVLLLAGVIAYRATRKDSTSADTPNPTAVTAPRSSTATTVGSGSSTSVAASTPATTTLTSSTGVTTTLATLATTTTSSSVVPTTAVAAAPTATATTVAPPDTATTVAAPPPTDAAATTAAPVAGAGAPSYSTLPDGTPAPVIVVFDTNQITITGIVPDQATKDKLQALAIANSKTQAAVANFLTIDPTIPSSTGVRIVELTSARFDTGSAIVAGQHAKEIDRITAIMNALPNVTVLIIGHADQVGSTASNYKLSAARAAAVVDYLVASGINPQRLSSRAVGDTDLLTLNNDAASLALNRRTELIIYGLI